jgi:transcriptional regulator with XRE-family HTH domain
MTRTRLSAELRSRAWSKSELARRAGVNQTTVIDVVNGRRVPAPGSEVLEKLARALEWPGDPSELLEDVTADASR